MLESQKRAIKKYQENNKDKLKEYHKEYYQKNKDKFKKNDYSKWKEWALKNKDKLKAYHKEYYQKNKADYLAREKEYKKDPIYRKKRHKQRKLSEKKAGKFEARDKYRRNVSKKLSDKDKKCQICGDLKSQFHHIDYNKFYTGYHLCLKHHREAHNNPDILAGLNINNYDYLVRFKKPNNKNLC